MFPLWQGENADDAPADFGKAVTSTTRRPSKTKAGLDMLSYTHFQSIVLNSFHSVAMTTASAVLQAARALGWIVTAFLTDNGEVE